MMLCVMYHVCCVPVSVRLSVTSMSSVKMAKQTYKQSTLPYNSTRTSFLMPKIWEYLQWVTLYHHSLAGS